MSSTHALMTAY